MRISELAESAGVPASTVRYYERVGLMGRPDRTASGYRDYGEDAAGRLLFIARARRMGLACEQITELIPSKTNRAEADEEATYWVGVIMQMPRDRLIGLDRLRARAERRLVGGQLEHLRNAGRRLLPGT